MSEQPKFTECNVNLELQTRCIPTISLPEGDLPLGSIGFGCAELPGLGPAVLVYVCDGSGQGAVAALTEDDLLQSLFALQQAAIASGLLVNPETVN